MKNKIKIYFLLITFLLSITACEDNWLDVNTDPNNPADATVELVFPAAAASTAFTLGGQWLILGSFWSQHWTQSTGANQYAGLDDYRINSNTFDRQYTELYAGALNDFVFVSQRAEQDEEWNYYLMAEVMRAYVFQILVDLYDKVPYSDAFLGTSKPNPKFDDGQAIYDDLIVRINNALAKDRSRQTLSVPASDDVIFNGDMSQWVRFANTLKLKIFMRQSEIRPAVASAGITALYNSGAAFLDSDAQFTSFANVQNFRNPYFAVQVTADGSGRGNVDVAASNTLLGVLTTANDPRISALFNTPAGGGTAYVGLNQGDYTNSSFANARALSQPDIGPTHPVMFLSRAESKFLQAEAVARFGVSGDAKLLYEQGIEASFVKWGVTGASDLYNGGVYQYDDTSTDTKIESIITQKWIAIANLNALESHFEFLRTGYPNIFSITPNNATTNILPKRLPYPATEQDNNAPALQAAGGQRQVIDRVWWDTAN